MGVRTAAKKVVGEAGADAAPIGVDGDAAPVERTRLLPSSGAESNGYSTMPRGEDVERLVEKKHFNLAGLPPKTFWILVSGHVSPEHSG